MSNRAPYGPPDRDYTLALLRKAVSDASRAQHSSVPALTATPDAVQLSNTTMGIGTRIVSDPGASFHALDVGKIIIVTGADTGGKTLCTTIAAVVSSTSVQTVAAAVTGVAGTTSAYGTDNAAAVQALINQYAPLNATIVFPANLGTGAYMFGTGLTLQSGTRLSGPGVTFIAALNSGVINAGGVLFIAVQQTDITPTLAANALVGDSVISLNGPLVAKGNTIVLAKLGGSLLAQSFIVRAVAGAAPQSVTLDRACNAGIISPGSSNISYTAGVAAVSRVTNPVTQVYIDGFTIKGRIHEGLDFAGVTQSVVSNILCDGSLGDAEDHWMLTVSGAFACRFQNIQFQNTDAIGFGIAGAESVYTDGFTYRGKSGTATLAVDFNGAIACRVDKLAISRVVTAIADFGGINCGFSNGSISEFTTYGTNHSSCSSPYVESMTYVCTGGNAMINIDSATVGFCGRKLYLAGGFNGMLMISDGSTSAKWQQIVIVPNSDTATDQFTAFGCVGAGHTTIQGLTVMAGGVGRYTALSVKDLLAVANTVTVDGFDLAGNDPNAGGLPVVSIDETATQTSKVFLKNGRINGQATTSCVQIGGGRVYVDTVELLGTAINGLWVYMGVGGALPTLRYERVRWIGAFTLTLRNDNNSFVNKGSVTLNGATPVAISFTDLQPNEFTRLIKCTNKNGATAFDAPVVTDTPGTGSSVVSVAGDTRIYEYEIA